MRAPTRSKAALCRRLGIEQPSDERPSDEITPREVIAILLCGALGGAIVGLACGLALL